MADEPLDDLTGRVQYPPAMPSTDATTCQD